MYACPFGTTSGSAITNQSGAHICTDPTLQNPSDKAKPKPVYHSSDGGTATTGPTSSSLQAKAKARTGGLLGLLPPIQATAAANPAASAAATAAEEVSPGESPRSSPSAQMHRPLVSTFKPPVKLGECLFVDKGAYPCWEWSNEGMFRRHEALFVSDRLSQLASKALSKQDRDACMCITQLWKCLHRISDQCLAFLDISE